MNKAQIWSVFAAFALFLGLYFGFDTRPGKHKTIDQSRAIQGESTSPDVILEKAKGNLKGASLEAYNSLESESAAATDDAGKAAALKKASAFWYQQQQLPAAGVMAEQVAEIENSDSSWSICGGAFFTALVAEKEPELREYCAKHAVKAFESAISLAPEKVEHRVNLALVWAESPPPDNPMQAVLMLRDLESKYPDQPVVYNALGRLAIKTGQWQKAVERLEKSWSLDNKNNNTPCLLARAYEGLGNNEKANEFSALCKGR